MLSHDMTVIGVFLFLKPHARYSKSGDPGAYPLSVTVIVTRWTLDRANMCFATVRFLVQSMKSRWDLTRRHDDGVLTA